MKIYTKAGDEGKTSLYGGKKISKADQRIDAYGTIDELNSFIGLLLEDVRGQEEFQFLMTIQNQLFNIGSHLAAGENHNFQLPEITEDMINAMEDAIDTMEKSLEPLKNFILPGGSRSIAHCHICRTVSRRAERRVVQLNHSEKVNPVIIKYLNRLSDYFFVLARYIGYKNGINEHLWKPD